MDDVDRPMDKNVKIMESAEALRTVKFDLASRITSEILDRLEFDPLKEELVLTIKPDPTNDHAYFKRVVFHGKTREHRKEL